MFLKVKETIKTLRLGYLDLFIIPWLGFGLCLTVESLKLVDSYDHNNVSLPIWFYIICFILSFSSFVIFLYNEWKNKNTPPKYVSICSITLILFTAIAIFTEPQSIVSTVTLYDGITTITTNIGIYAKFIHFFNFIFIITGFYTGLFIITKRIRNTNILIGICYLFYAFSLAVIIYSLCHDDYLLFFSRLFGSEEALKGVKAYIPVSFFGHSNVYGFFNEVGIIVSLLHFSLTKKKRCYFITGYYYILLLLTICRTGIIIATALLFIYFIYKVILLLFSKDKRLKTVSITILSSIVLLIIGAFLFYLFGPLKERIDIVIIGNHTLRDRAYIWNIAFEIINTKPLMYGTGFGIYNSIIFDATSTKNMLNSTTHNFFISILGRVGFVGLVCYFYILVTCILIIIKGYKKNAAIAASLSFSFSLFFLHSFVEDNYYILIAICMVIMAVDNIWKHQEINSVN